MGRWWVALFLWSVVPSLGAEELTVSAAISLKEAFIRIGQDFEAQRPGDKVIFNFGASGELAQQIARGAPVDVFASAALKPMQPLAQKNLVSSPQIFARNRLVLVVPKGKPPIATLSALLQVKTLALGNPQTVPVGQYSKAALTEAGVYQPLVDAQKLIFGENVRQVLAYVESGNADAGLVYATDAKVSDRVEVSFMVPEKSTEPIVYPIAVVKASPRLSLAEAFVQQVLGKAGQAMLRSQGFLAP